MIYCTELNTLEEKSIQFRGRLTSANQVDAESFQQSIA